MRLDFSKHKVVNEIYYVHKLSGKRVKIYELDNGESVIIFPTKMYNKNKKIISKLLMALGIVEK